MYAQPANRFAAAALWAVGIIVEYSVPLICGVVAGLIAANAAPHWYESVKEFHPFAGIGLEKVLGHHLTVHFILNGMFMCLFFGIAAKEITASALPGGSLNPLRRAINPLVGTLGGVFGPAGLYLLLAWLLYQSLPSFPSISGGAADGWAIPTATDIALAWLVARLVFGALHPAVNFLLLLAVADDAIGLVIIAVFYPDPAHPVAPLWLLFTVGGMAAAFIIRRLGVQRWWVYIIVGGALSWVGLAKAGVEPALALVPIVPFLPSRGREGHAGGEHNHNHGHQSGGEAAAGGHNGHGPLDQFEHQLNIPVTFGLFFFAFANAGVAFSSIGPVTGMVLAALIIGKGIGITLFSWAAALAGFPLPAGMRVLDLLVASIIAGLGLTVALFVAGKAFPDGSEFSDPGKMGAVISIVAGPLAILLGILTRVRREPARRRPRNVPTPD